MAPPPSRPHATTRDTATHTASGLSSDLARRLAEARTARGLTQSEVAERMGVSQPALSRLESADDSLMVATLQRWSSALDLDLDVELRGQSGGGAGDATLVALDGSEWLYVSAPPFSFGAFGEVPAPGADELGALLGAWSEQLGRRDRRNVHVVLDHDPAQPDQRCALVGIQLRRSDEASRFAELAAAHRFAVTGHSEREDAQLWYQDCGEPVEYPTRIEFGTQRWTASYVAAIGAHVAPSWVVELAGRGERFVLSLRAELGANRGAATLERATITVLSRSEEPLRQVGGVLLVPARGTQLAAAASTRPGSATLTAAAHNLRLDAVALMGPRNLGDDTGHFVGVTTPTRTPVYLDPTGDPGRSPLVAVLGEPGHGQMLVENLVPRTPGSGRLVKLSTRPSDDLDGTADQLVVSAEHPGCVDPWRWMPADIAGEVAADILDILTSDLLGDAQRLELRREIAAASREAHSFTSLVATLALWVQATIDELRREAPGIDALFSDGTPAEPLGASTLVTFDGIDVDAGRTTAGPRSHAGRVGDAVMLATMRAAEAGLARNDSPVPPRRQMLVIDDATPFAHLLHLLPRRSGSFAPTVVAVFGDAAAATRVELGRVFACGARDFGEADAIARTLGLPATAETRAELIAAGLEAGTAVPILHRDAAGRVGPIELDPPADTERRRTTAAAPDSAQSDEPARLSPAVTVGATVVTPGASYDIELADGTTLTARTLVGINTTTEADGALELTLRTTYGVTELVDWANVDRVEACS